MSLGPLSPNISDISEDVDVHFNQTTLQTAFPEIAQQIFNDRVKQEINGLKTDLQQCQKKNSDLTKQVYSLQLLNYRYEQNLGHAEQRNTDLQDQLAQYEKINNDLKAQLKQSEQTNNYLKVQSEQSKTVECVHTVSVMNNALQAMANMKKQLAEVQNQYKKKLEDMHKEVEQLKAVNSKQRTEIEHYASVNKDKKDGIAKLKCALRTYTDTIETKNLTAKHSGRYEVMKPLFVCKRCQQTFGSQGEMESSLCTYHKQAPCATGKSGQYYYKCCQLESNGKPSLGCTQGKHDTSKGYVFFLKER